MTICPKCKAALPSPPGPACQACRTIFSDFERGTAMVRQSRFAAIGSVALMVGSVTLMVVADVMIIGQVGVLAGFVGLIGGAIVGQFGRSLQGRVI